MKENFNTAIKPYVKRIHNLESWVRNHELAKSRHEKYVITFVILHVITITCLVFL